MWIEEQKAAIGALKAPTAVPVGIGMAFERHLRGDATARRLVADFLPKVPVEKLATFVAVITDVKTESGLLDLTAKWGQSFKRVLRGKARRKPSLQESSHVFLRPSEVLKRADDAFDVRRQGLTHYLFGAVIIKRYVQFKGLRPTARELSAILEAGFAATGRPRVIDYDLLRRGLKRYERTHPIASATPDVCARLIELTKY